MNIKLCDLKIKYQYNLYVTIRIVCYHFISTTTDGAGGESYRQVGLGSLYINH